MHSAADCAGPSHVVQEREALEQLRQAFETELQAARSEVARAQQAVGGQDFGRQGDYQMKIQQLQVKRTQQTLLICCAVHSSSGA